jgi:hypothetical protein
MKILKQGEQRLFETDAETAAVVSRMLADLEKNGMDAVCKKRQFDDWDPPSPVKRREDDPGSGAGDHRYRLLPAKRA